MERHEAINKIAVSLYTVKDLVYTRSDHIAEVFGKSHDVVLSNIAKIRAVYNEESKINDEVCSDEKIVLSDKIKKLKFLNHVFEKDKLFYVDVIFFGVLTCEYVSKRATYLKYIYLNELISAQQKVIEKKHLTNLGCNEIPKSVLGPVLKDIMNNVDRILLKLEDVSVFMEQNKKQESSATEKLYKQLKQEKMLNKIKENVRQKTIDIMNKQISRKKSHGLVYNMEEVVKIEMAERAAIEIAERAEVERLMCLDSESKGSEDYDGDDDKD